MKSPDWSFNTGKASAPLSAWWSTSPLIISRYYYTLMSRRPPPGCTDSSCWRWDESPETPQIISKHLQSPASFRAWREHRFPAFWPCYKPQNGRDNKWNSSWTWSLSPRLDQISGFLTKIWIRSAGWDKWNPNLVKSKKKSAMWSCFLLKFHPKKFARISLKGMINSIKITSSLEMPFLQEYLHIRPVIKKFWKSKRMISRF